MEHSHLLTPDTNLGKMKDQNENIQVYVRVRPMNGMERSKNCIQVLDCPGAKEVVVKERTVNNITKTFTFDRVFAQRSKQIEVYKTVVVPLLEDVLLGYNCTVFAYGQTGTGKTFTMEGERSNDPNLSWEEDPLTGIVPRALSQLFDELRLQNVEFTVRVSLLELYNEELFDLLSPSDDNKMRTLRLFEDSNRKGSVIIQGLEELTVRSKQEVYQIMERGREKRKTAATQMNASSSRSHTVFTVTVHIKESNLDGEELLKIGKLHLVDLAGSENIGRSGAVDKRAREAGSINQSLLTLGRVITALVERAPHVPYRESKLTRLLQDSLGGRTKTSIIATVSPASYSLEETLSTLDYAHRAKNIMNRPELNQKLTKKAVMKSYTDEIERLRRDLIATREKNGVFMDKENYDHLTSQIESQGQDLCDKIQQVRTLQESVDQKEEELQLVKSQWEETKDDLAAANQVINETRAKVEKLQMALLETQLERDQQQHLVETHVKTEEALSKEAGVLLQTTEETTSTLDKLYRKLDRKKHVEHSNIESGRRFRQDLTEQFNSMCSNFEIFRVDHATFCGEQRMRLDQFLATQEIQLAILTNLITNYLKEMKHLKGKSLALVSEETSSLEAYVSQIKTHSGKITEENGKTLSGFLEELVINGTKDLAERMLHLHQYINVLSEGFKNHMEGQKCYITKFVIERLQKLEQNRQAVENLLSEQRVTHRRIATVVSAQGTANDEYLKTVKSDAEAVVNMIQQLVQNATSYHEKVDAGLDEVKRESTATETAVEEFVHNALADIDKSATETNVLKSTGVNNNIAVNELLKDQSEKAQNEYAAASEKICALENKANCFVSRQKDSYLTSLKWMVHQAEQHKAKCTQFAKKHEDSSQAAYSYAEKQMVPVLSGVNKMYDEEMKTVGDVQSELEGHCNQFSEWSENTRALVLQQSGKLGEFWDSTYLVDLPTGATPQKKTYDYPRNLSATSPHERIIKRFTSKRQHEEKNEIF